MIEDNMDSVSGQIAWLPVSSMLLFKSARNPQMQSPAEGDSMRLLPDHPDWEDGPETIRGGWMISRLIAGRNSGCGNCFFPFASGILLQKR